MSLTITLLFISTVLMGLYLVFLGVRHRKRSARLGLIHATLAASGIVLLLVQITSGPTNKMDNIAALFLLLAIIGGGLVFALREDNRPPGMIMVTAHAIMGVVGVTLLLVNLFS